MKHIIWIVLVGGIVTACASKPMGRKVANEPDGIDCAKPQDSYEKKFCTMQASARHTSCERASIEAVKAYAQMHLRTIDNVELRNVVQEDATYEIKYKIPGEKFELERYHSVRVSTDSRYCYVVFISM